MGLQIQLEMNEEWKVNKQFSKTSLTCEKKWEQDPGVLVLTFLMEIRERQVILN